MPFQRHTFTVQECWFQSESLRDFESQIAELGESDCGVVALVNMERRPILTVRKGESNSALVFSAADSAQLGMLEFTMTICESEIVGIYNRLRAYPKWW